MEGKFAWLNERTLLLQPDFPGLQRGIAYRVSVDGERAGLAQDFSQTFTVTGKLTVDNVIPADGDVEVPARAQILVQFSRSVAALTVLSELDERPVIEFDPPIPGRGEWLNTALYRYFPERLDPSTTYQLRIPAGLTSQADGTLEDDFEWSFTTFGPALDTFDPASRSRFVQRARPIVLTFNQPMDRASVSGMVEILDEDGQRVHGEWSFSEGDTVATYTPLFLMEISTRYEIDVPAGILSARGAPTLIERFASFSTSDPPRVVSKNSGRFGVNVQFNNPMDADSIEDRAFIVGVDREDTRVGLSSYDGRQLTLSTRLEASTTYVFEIAAGATDRDGLSFEPYSFTFTTRPLAKSIAFAKPANVTTFFSGGDQALFFFATNVATATFRLYPLTESEARGIQQRGGTPRPPLNQRLWLPSSDPILNWSETVTGDLNSLTLNETTLAQNGAPLPKGDYYLVASGADFPTAITFSVIDTTIVTKLSIDELLVWVLDYESGAPLSGVRVDVTGPRLSVSSGVTDASGLMSIPIPNPREFTIQSRQYVAVVDGGGRFGVGATYWRNGSEPRLLGVPMDIRPREFVAHMFTDRPIYRTGETVSYKLVVRIDDDANYTVPGEIGGLAIVVRDPRGEELMRTPVTLNPIGTFAGEVPLPPDASTGSYSLRLVYGVNDRGITSTSFRAAEFRVPEFLVEVEADRADYVDGETIEATATASFFFGGALDGARANWTVLGSPAFVRFAEFSGYSFADFDFFREARVREPLRAQGETVTAPDGRASFAVPATLRGDEGTQDFQVAVSVTDQSDQVVASSATVRVHPASYYAGLRPAQRVSTTGKPVEINVVSVDVTGVPAPGRRITVEVFERKWITTKIQTEDGGRRFVSEPKDTLLATLPVTTDGAGEGRAIYTPTAAGSLRIVASITDERGRTARAASFVWVSGRERVPWRIRNDDVIELISDRDAYKVGDVAEILIPAPFEGAIGLVTIERGKIIERSVRTFETTSEVLRIPIEDGHVPNIFVGVVLYRAPTADDPVPRYRVGYVELPVSTDPRVLVVTITADRELARPGDVVRYDVKVTDTEGRGRQAELSVAIVDKAVLSLAAEIGPNGLRAFWFQRGLGVQTASSASVSIDRTNDIAGKGGGGDPRLREDFQNTALWTGQLLTDLAGNASFEVTMPDNLTTWRTQVRAISGDTMVGETTHELLSTQPLLLRPALPRFLRAGDSATLRLLLRNATKSPVPVDVTLDAQGVELIGSAARSGVIAPGSSSIFEWPVEARTAGTARFTFTARGTGAAAGLGDAVAIEIPVHLDVTPETTATGGVVTDQSAVEAIYLPDYAITEVGSLEVSLQASLVGALSSELSAFSPRPLESVERVASRVVATIGARRAEGAPVPPSVAGDVARLIGAQHTDGGWGWCFVGCRTNITMTGWVMIALQQAQEAQISVPSRTVTLAGALVRRHLNRRTDVERPPDQNQHAMLIYAVRDSAGGVGADATARAILEQHRSTLANWGRAYLVLALLDSERDPQAGDEVAVRTLINDLTSEVIASANGNHWEDERIPGSMHSNLRTTALVLRALVAAEPRHPLIEETVRWLVTARTAERWQTSIARAQAIASLGAFAELTGERAGDYDYLAQLDGDELLQGHFQPSGGSNLASVKVPLTELKLGAVSLLSVLREQATPGRLYYGLNLRYVTPAQGVEAVSRGFAVSHEYSLLADPDTRITSARLGDVIRIKVTVVTPADRKFVVIEDFLPAGLEPIDPTLSITPPELKLQLQQERKAALGVTAPAYYAPWYFWYFNPWDHVDSRDDRVTLFATDLPKGVHEYIYFARATSEGDYFLAPAHAEETYFPEVFGRSDSSRFIIGPAAQ